NRRGNNPGFGQASGDTRCLLLRLRRRQDQGKPPLLRLADAAQADRRAAQLTAATRARAEGTTKQSSPPHHRSAKGTESRECFLETPRGGQGSSASAPSPSQTRPAPQGRR